MRILCDFCGQPLFDGPLSYYDRHANRDIAVADNEAHATTVHAMGMVTVEIRDSIGHGLGGGMHQHPEVR